LAEGSKTVPPCAPSPSQRDSAPSAAGTPHPSPPLPSPPLPSPPLPSPPLPPCNITAPRGPRLESVGFRRILRVLVQLLCFPFAALDRPRPPEHESRGAATRPASSQARCVAPQRRSSAQSQLGLETSSPSHAHAPIQRLRLFPSASRAFSSGAVVGSSSRAVVLSVALSVTGWFSYMVTRWLIWLYMLFVGR
jgi:hypothetical protein